MNQPTTIMMRATPAKVITFGRIGHWPGSFGLRPRNCDAAPSKTEFRSTWTDFGLLAIAQAAFFATAAGAGFAVTSGIGLAAAASGADAAATAGATSCGRLTRRR